MQRKKKETIRKHKDEERILLFMGLYSLLTSLIGGSGQPDVNKPSDLQKEKQSFF